MQAVDIDNSRQSNTKIKLLFITKPFVYLKLRTDVFEDKKYFSKNKSNLCRSSPPEVFCKKGALRNMTKFTGKLLC